ncbi:MAG TPA: C1 family peptidase [Pirellulales bacterium]|nr:C1 family peptidase [Pirellulales bacterium]
MYVSKLRPNETIIGDHNAHERCSAPGSAFGRGYIARDRKRIPQASMPFSAKFNLPLIPRSEWDARIEEMEKTKTRLSDISDAQGIKSLNQQQTNYCWCNAVVGCVQLIRAKAGEPYVLLSAASVAAPVKGFSNVGGWGGEALSYIVKHGIASTEFWPANAISQQYQTPEEEANRKLHKVTEWLDLDEGNFDQVMTCLFNRMPVAAGLNWWGHEVMFCDPVKFGANDYGVRFRNSWDDSWGDHGFDTLHESKARPADACVPLVSTGANV